MRILLLTGDAGESQEIFYAKYRLEEEGWRVEIVAPTRRVFQDEVDARDFDALVLPGGRAPEYLRNRPKAMAIVRHFVEAGKPIAANCHGPLLVIAAGGARGKAMTCYPELEPNVRAAGAEFVDREVVVDGSLVSVRGWPDNGPWMREFVKLLKSRQRQC